MRAEDLRPEELIRTDPVNGLPFFGSARLVVTGAGPFLSRLGQDLMERLGEHLVTMDLKAEDRGVGGDTRSGIDEASRGDGLAAGLGIPRGREHYAAEVLQDQAVLLAPEEEIGRLAHLLALRVGRYSLQPSQTVPDLRLSVRELSDARIGFLMNDGPEAIHFDLELIEDEPALLERWEPRDGTTVLLAAHTEVSEITRVPMRLGPGESALLVLSPADPLGEDQPGPKAERTSPEVVVIDVLDTPTAVGVDASYRILEGDVRVEEQPPDWHALAPRLGPWAEAGLGGLSGTVRYEFAFTVAPEYLGQPVYLDLGTVRYAARVKINGEELPPSLWPPYVLEISRHLRGGEHALAVQVTNTLANQACDDAVLAQARAMGWLNTYYDRALPMMAESLPSGLLGPVRLYIRR